MAEQGIASLVPLNTRAFFRNLMRDEGDTSSLLTAEDFTDDQIEYIYKEIERQTAKQDDIKERAETFLEVARKALDPSSPEGKLYRPQEGVGYTVSDPEKVTYEQFMALDDPAGREVVARGATRSSADAPREYYQKYKIPRTEAEVTALIQDEIDKAEGLLKKYKGNETDVIYDYKYGEGINEYNPLTVIKKAFTSDAYNIATTLGQFKAIKNKDGTVTIRDTYNWTGQRGDPEGEIDVSLSDFIKNLPKMLSPEIAGNLLMRSLFKDKQSPVEFTLPPRQTTEMPESYRDGGRVRLI
tara:strand:- start:236 stop:1129 length:894 start_codon:yes stop_codon:yes gene_type:complete